MKRRNQQNQILILSEHQAMLLSDVTVLGASDLEVGKVLQGVHAMLERKKLNLRIDADLDICLLIISQGLGRENSVSV